jgi:hydrogenase nickel insertion protein HypA
MQSIKAVFNKSLQKVRNTQVARVNLVIGEIAELDQNTIEKEWHELSKGTSLEQAKLRFRLIIAEAQCMACFKKYHPENGVIHCPYCGSFGAKILSGEEFHVESIDTIHE